MKIEVKTLMDENEMLSHIFLGCISKEDLRKIKNKFVQEKDWQKESVTIPVEMKIGGISVNPKEFFDEWKNQMQEIVNIKASELVSKKFGSEKILSFTQPLQQISEILAHFEKEITWESKNPFL